MVVPRGVAGHVLQLGQRLDARVAAADEHEGQGRVADGRVARRGGDVHLLDDVVAQADGLLDGLEADGVVREAGDRQGARDRTGREDEFVVRQTDGAGAVLGRGEGGDGGGAPRVVDAVGLADDDPALVQDPAQRHHDMARGDVSGRRLGQEGLVRHVRVRGHHGDLDRPAPQLGLELPLQAQRRVHPDVSAADHENAHRFCHHPMTQRASGFVHSPDKLCDWRELLGRVANSRGPEGRSAGQGVSDTCWAGSDSVGFRSLVRSGGTPCGRTPSELSPAQLCSYPVGMSGHDRSRLSGAGSLRGETLIPGDKCTFRTLIGRPPSRRPTETVAWVRVRAAGARVPRRCGWMPSAILNTYCARRARCSASSATGRRWRTWRAGPGSAWARSTAASPARTCWSAA
ncbi:hypothetical protein SXANM310S_02311 [Streptomyces xanthochromogenes]